MKFIQMQSTIQTCLNKQFLLVAKVLYVYRECIYEHTKVRSSVPAWNWTHDMRGLMHNRSATRIDTARATCTNIVGKFCKISASIGVCFFVLFVDVIQFILSASIVRKYDFLLWRKAIH